MLKSNRSLLVAVLGWLAVSCGEDRIRGVVEDPFSRPLEGVKVEIEKSGFVAETNNSGEFALAYAPGSFNLKYSKEGFTTEVVPLSISQSAEFPAAKVVLFPIPGKAGIFVLAKSEVTELQPRHVKRFEQMRAMSQRTRYFAESVADLVDVPPGKSRFVDTLDGEQRLFRVTEEGLIYDVTHHLMTPEEHYSDLVGDSVLEVGDEKLLVHTADLRGGIYAWVTIGQGPVIGSSGPSRECYIFRVGASNEAADAADKSRRLSWPEALKRTMADIRSIATAWEARATDWNTYSISGIDGEVSTQQLEVAVSPTYIRQFPANDAWSGPFRFSVDSEGQQYSLASDGPDGIPGNSDDIQYRNGNFTQYPPGARP